MEHVITLQGVLTLTFMMAMYALESRHRGVIAAFARGCALPSSYGFLARTWPFGVVEALWTLVALRRLPRAPRAASPVPDS